MDLKVYALLNAKIKELAGGGLTQAEVEKIVTDEVAKIVAGAPEDFDTLKEMSDWISSHEESAASMNSAIQTNASNISALDTNKVNKVDGKSLISDTEIARLAKVDNYDDSGIKADIQTNADNIDTNKTNISTLAKHMTGDLTDSDFLEDSTVTMTKTVPSGMGDYAAIKVIGGKTVKDEENQVLKNAVVESVVSVGKNLFNNTPIKLINTKKESNYVWTNTIADTRERIFPHMVLYKGSSVTKELTTSVNNNRYSSIFTKTGNADSIRIGHSGGAYDIKISLDISMLSDKTDYTVSFTMIGSPNVIGSVKIFNVMIEKSSIVTDYSIPFKTTLLIPDALKSLPDWGCAVNDEIYNYVDFENGIYHHKVGSVDLGLLTWEEFNADRKIYRGIILNLKIANSDKLSSVICGKYKTVKGSDTWVNGDISTDASSNGNVFICDTSYSSISEFKTALSGVMLNYEFVTEELIDIPDMLMPIRCESGGTITFTNEHNLDMPNTVIYKKEVSLI